MCSLQVPARALSPGFTPGGNFLRWRLLDPAARELDVDWDEATEVAVSGLREVAVSAANDQRLRALIAELSATSPRFRELWARANAVTVEDRSTCVIRSSAISFFAGTGSPFPTRGDSTY